MIDEWLDSVAEDLIELERRLESELVKAESATLDEANRHALSLSRGPFKSAQLAAMGHPYARRAPDPPMDSAVINRQGGEFADSWETHGPAVWGDEINSELENTDPIAELLDRGTRLMIRRPTIQRIAERIEARRGHRIATAWAVAIEGLATLGAR